MFVPLMTPALFLMGIGPLARWKDASLPDIATRLKWAFAVSITTALVLPFALGAWTPLVSFGLALALWIAASTAVNLKERLASLSGSLRERPASQPHGHLREVAPHLRVAGLLPR